MLQLQLWACACPSVCLLSVCICMVHVCGCAGAVLFSCGGQTRYRCLPVSPLLLSTLLPWDSVCHWTLSWPIWQAWLVREFSGSNRLGMPCPALPRHAPPCLAFYKKFLGFELMSSCFQTSILQPVEVDKPVYWVGCPVIFCLFLSRLPSSCWVVQDANEFLISLLWLQVPGDYHAS